MNVQELLEELRIGILNDRSDRVAGTSDYLWTDAMLVRYINEAQRRFAVKGLVIRDSTTAEVVQVTLVEGQTDYTLHPSIIAVISAKLDGEDADLQRAGHSLLDSYTRPSSDVWDLSQYTHMSSGKPLAYTTDEQVGEDDDGSLGAVSMRVYPAPSVDYAGEVIRLRVVRKPLDPLTHTNLSAIPEIPEDHHFEMLDWAAYLALRINDQDAGNLKRASDFALSFENHVREARNLVMRKLFAPKQWGFGRGGWSWEANNGGA